MIIYMPADAFGWNAAEPDIYSNLSPGKRKQLMFLNALALQ